MERKEGYYWVNRYNKWSIGYYNGCNWRLIGSDDDFTDSDFVEIGKTKIKMN